ncbi:uncharacterized protein V3H82_023866 [Fundulus diaphanus]
MSSPALFKSRLSQNTRIRLSDPEPDAILRPEPSCLSFRSNQSKSEPLQFNGGLCTSEPDQSHYFLPSVHQGPGSGLKPGVQPEASCLSLKTNRSKAEPLLLSPGQWRSDPDLKEDQQSPEVPSAPSAQQHQTQLDSKFMLLEDNMVTFVKKELKKIQRVLSPDYPECSEKRWEDEEVLEGEDEEQRKSSKRALLKITVFLLKRMKQEKLAERLQTITPSICQDKLKSGLKKKFQCVFEGIAKAGSPTLLNQIYTELYITEGGTGEVNDEHEVRQIEAASRKPHRPETTIRLEDIFKVPPGGDQPIRTVMTKGVAGIGKTVLTQKFTLDWAEGKAHQNIHFIFPFTFRELNVLKEKKFSLVDLVHSIQFNSILFI